MVRKANGRLQSDPGTPRARRRDRQRDAILRAAAQLFRERGFADTGMRDIAEAADLSAANLYHYFDGKHDLLFYCQDRALDRMLEAVAVARRASSSAPERLRVVFTAHLHTLLDDIEGATAHLQIESLPPVVAERDRQEARSLRTGAAPADRRRHSIRRAGRHQSGDCRTRAILGAMNWTVTWFRPDGADSAATVGEVIARFLVRGVAIRTPAIKRTLSVVPTSRVGVRRTSGEPATKATRR